MTDLREAPTEAEPGGAPAIATGAEGPSSQARREAGLYRHLVLVLATAYAVAAVLPAGFRDRHPALASMLFGFDQLRPLGWAALGLPLLAAVALRLPWDGLRMGMDGLHRRLERLSSRARVLLALVVGAYSFTVFLGLRNGFVNPDGGAFTGYFHADAAVGKPTVSHDEMLELYVHSRFWHYTSRAFGWSVEYSYQFLSSLAGGAFVVLLLAFGWLLFRDRRWILLVVGVVSAGFMQLFFGEVENYTLVTLLLMVYFQTGYLYLAGRVSLVVPSAVLAVAVCFHLLAAFALASLGYLYVVAIRRGQLRSLAGAAATVVAIPVAVVGWFHFHGLPLEVIRTSNAFGQAGDLRRFAAPDVVYHGQITSLVFLLFPPVLLFVPLVAYRRIALTPFNVFMSLATLAFLGFVFVWRADLGVHNDWNLYAPAGLPLALLFWHNFARAEGMFNKAGIAAALVLTSAVHSCAWIIRNHV